MDSKRYPEEFKIEAVKQVVDREVSVGHNVFLGPNVGVYTTVHPLDTGRCNAAAGVCKSSRHLQ